MNVKFENTDFECEACIYGKHHRSTFKTRASRAKYPGELVHTDVCGPMNVKSYGGAKYFILFKDDFSQFRKIYFMKEKIEVFEIIIDFLKTVKRDTGHTVKCLRSDNGTEYINKRVQSLLLDNGIQHQTTIPYTPEQNGRAERKNADNC